MRIRRPSPALVIACVALLVALGGTGYATVVNVPRNSVGTLELKRSAVKSAKIAPSAVRTAHVLNGSLLAADFKAGTRLLGGGMSVSGAAVTAGDVVITTSLRAGAPADTWIVGARESTLRARRGHSWP